MNLTQDLLNFAQAMAVLTNAHVIKIEHAEALTKRYLKSTGYDVERKIKPEADTATVPQK